MRFPASDSVLSALSLSGTGTADDLYLIGSAADLAEFRDTVNGGSAGARATLTSANEDLLSFYGIRHRCSARCLALPTHRWNTP